MNEWLKLIAKEVVKEAVNSIDEETTIADKIEEAGYMAESIGESAVELTFSILEDITEYLFSGW